MPHNEGHGIKYRVIDEYDGLDSEFWAVSQSICDSSQFSSSYFTQTFSGSSDSNLSSHKEVQLRTIDGIDFLHSQGWSNNQGYFNLPSLIPKTFSIGDNYLVNFPSSREHSIVIEEKLTKTYASTVFENCVKISIGETGLSDYTDGQGYYIFAPNIGIVEIYYTRGIGQKSVHFTYLDHKTFNPISISGTIKDGGTPVEDLYIQYSDTIFLPDSRTDEEGKFTLSPIYGNKIVLWLGYEDEEQKHRLAKNELTSDYPIPYSPIIYMLENLYDGKVIEIDLSEL